MKEYIEREALFKRINTGMNIIEAMQAMADCPTADVRENVRGEWILKTAPHPCGESCWRECSNCGEEPLRNRWNRSEYLSDFCPNCGADMRKEQKND